MPASPSCSLPVYDVVIIGAGIVGSSTAYQVCKDKKPEQKVLLLEQFELLHANGSSHGNSRITRYSYTDPVYANMGMLALQMWKQAEKESLARVYKPTGGIDFGKKEDPNMIAVIESARINGYKVEIYEGEEIPKRFPLLKAVPGIQVVYQETSGVLNAYEAVRMMQWLASKHGCEIHEKEKVLSTEDVKPCSHSKHAGVELVKVTTSKGQYLTKKLVVTAGAWVNKVLGAYKVPSAPLLDVDVQLMSYAFWKATPKFKSEWNRMPIWINYDYQNFDLGAYGFPSLSTEKKGYMKASLHYPLPNERYTNPDARSYEMPKEKYEFMKGFLKTYFREDSIEFLDYEEAKKQGNTTTCLYTNSPTTDFIIDTHPVNKNIVVFSGCSGHAFKFGPVIGHFISQLLHDPSLGKFENKYERSKFSFDKCLLKSKM